jgi:acid phosphatase type 7
MLIRGNCVPVFGAFRYLQKSVNRLRRTPYVFILMLASGCVSSKRDLPARELSVEFPALKTRDSVVVMAAGDIADCTTQVHRQTAALINARKPDAVFALGDLAYPNGTLEEFVDCYDTSWGAFRKITRPAVGNHEYHTPHAGPYYAYFSGISGEAFQGYYSFEVGPWHAIALNSVCAGVDPDVNPDFPGEAGGCDKDSAQAKWLRDDLAKHPGSCTVAYWHHPRFTSGNHGSAEHMRDLFKILDDAKVDLVLNGHEHNYERFEPQDADGNRAASGVRQIVIGSGGKALTSFGASRANSAYRNNTDFGVLELSLETKQYTWKFVTTDGRSLDAGTAQCRLK